ncbi:hypothetical protein MUN46_004185 [Mesosutterella sp. AGMB02718]|uniref:Uncharacterized protein n=1 Tax=Mesosutterella faecium TaxID=2925194 RepID=A0ABT7ILA5_9BURK|nr:hypothetical protein [Mesosutterella sp. AGMB02718]MDL2059141.1 hypothetical protein [Mesosutterella sp. AGMB02718]
MEFIRHISAVIACSAACAAGLLLSLLLLRGSLLSARRVVA